MLFLLPIITRSPGQTPWPQYTIVVAGLFGSPVLFGALVLRRPGHSGADPRSAAGRALRPQLPESAPQAMRVDAWPAPATRSVARPSAVAGER
ncbi:hypothetical protein GCM10018962_43420 [Dactylosporangium matsuzakiense]|uniref:Uncharacterized protein n=2 Tax=Dactylosporangium matsuzakiense TaxID=53360 RepID=A0A9W6KGW4_9ACTN|nr:hypothetical protein GCM10017581_015800 [Dactylosporangium matsuzakiense]